MATPSSPLRVHELHRGARAKLLHARCTAGPHDTPYPERHNGFSIALVERGEFLYRPHDERRPHALRPGWLLLCRDDAEFTCTHERPGGDDCAVLDIPAELLEDAARDVEGFQGPIFPRPVLPPLSRVSARLRLVSAAVRTGAPVDIDEAALEVAEAVARAFAGARHARGKQRSAADVERVRAAARLLEERCEEAWSIGDVAREVDLSPFHFLRLFRGELGVTPHQHLVNARVRRAVSLLLDTSRPVTSIAYDVGFGDLSNFVRTFHRQVGVSPGVFRRRGLTRPPAAPPSAPRTVPPRPSSPHIAPPEAHHR